MISKENISYENPDIFPECKDCNPLKIFKMLDEKTLTTNGFFSSTLFVDLKIKCDQLRFSQTGNYFIDPEKKYPIELKPEKSDFPFTCPVLKANRGLTNPK